MEALIKIAHSQPHSAYAALTHGLTCKWSYLSRSTSGIGPLLEPLEDVVQMKLLPVLTGRSATNQSERDLFALPVQMGGLAVVNPAELAASEFSTSGKITEPLTNVIM